MMVDQFASRECSVAEKERSLPWESEEGQTVILVQRMFQAGGMS